MNIFVRDMMESDIEDFYQAFKEQGWDKPLVIFQTYLHEQADNRRKVFVATCNDMVAGYATLLQNDPHGPFANLNIPTVSDFNVLEKFQKLGIGSMILDAIEDSVKKYADCICLGVGLHQGYGSAQRMYIKRGYIPDGSGVWYQNERLKQNADCKNDDDLVLYLLKKL